MKLKLTINGVVYDVEVEVEEDAPTLGIFPPGGNFGGMGTPAVTPHASPPAASAKGIQAPLAGTVANVLVEVGQAFGAGETLLVLEAMKMETAITAPADGEIAAVRVKKGDSVAGGQVLVELK
ncbi:acetyl-CoA carboxylase biotin carboxyl carrier protein subunit [Deinococcus cavernae]|uniref:Acetyl-CoA carboxylase biotin carboxyl carrier protein subunit n=1 Tax=Deinococcus cavernae TaxID=2320857 RepID=A0A418VB22_9DEIO|nr:acetyl-CoA carboxylase biotin carboxyl carrier protein subunit [Deinococcus cavernae]RJF73277.1 acetyl-CoA carboxylase biotin carboxyl carrier protein subunit [Deinococcus cavernae]